MSRFRLFARTALITALMVSGAHAQEAATIEVLERQIVSAAHLYGPAAPPRAATHELKLTLVYFSDSGWPREAILEATRSAAVILGQCGVALQEAQLVLIKAPERYQYFFTPVARELARTLRLSKPTVYFVTDTRQQPAFDAEAIGRANSATRPELADTVWIMRATRDLTLALAHELVHVLMDSGEHVEEPGNLMREDTAPENTRLSAAQCARLRDTGIAHGLLRPLN